MTLVKLGTKQKNSAVEVQECVELELCCKPTARRTQNANLLLLPFPQ